MKNGLLSWGKTFLSALLAVILILLVFSGASVRAQNNNNNNNNNRSNNRSNNSNNNNNNNDNNNDGGNTGARDFYRWGYRSAVGGFSIDAQNALQAATEEETASIDSELRALLASVPSELDRPSAMRKVSLRRLSELLRGCADGGRPIPDSALFLGGLTRIDYVVAVPEENDIYLAGPAEGWTVGADGSVVGKESGKPILRLEDLLTLFRSWNTPNPEVITCSIDPTPEGIRAVASLDADADQAERTRALGFMDVTFSGIPAESRMARILAAADYRLKTISLGYETVSISNFPSYFSMIQAGNGTFGQRFWITPEYKTLYHDSDALAWKLSDSSVKTLTEREHFTADGGRKGVGKKDPRALKWASNMTKRYDDVAKTVPVFAEAKNCMDLALAAALIYYKGLPQKSGFSLDALTDASVVSLPAYPAPKKVPGFSLKRVSNRRGDTVSVTGGISINPWETVESNAAEDAQLDQLAATVPFSGHEWFAD